MDDLCDGLGRPSYFEILWRPVSGVHSKRLDRTMKVKRLMRYSVRTLLVATTLVAAVVFFLLLPTIRANRFARLVCDDQVDRAEEMLRPQLVDSDPYLSMLRRNTDGNGSWARVSPVDVKQLVRGERKVIVGPEWGGGTIGIHRFPSIGFQGTQLAECFLNCDLEALELDGQVVRMNVRAKTILLALVFVMTGAMWSLRHSTPWGGDDQIVPPRPFEPWLSEPSLAFARPLPSDVDTAKPVVIADHRGQVAAIAQEVSRARPFLHWYSPNHGRSWPEPRRIRAIPDDHRLNDPAMVSDRRGRAYFISISDSDPNVSPYHVDNVLRRSLDGGQIWEAPITLPVAGDRPVLAVSPNGQRLVVATYIHEPVIVVSNDRGLTWKRLSASPLAGTPAVAFSVVIDDAGRIAGTWIAEGDGSRSIVATSTDDGATWQEIELVSNLQSGLSHSFAGGRLPVLAMDGEGGLHAAFVNSGGVAVLVRHSRDWQHWGQPLQLSDDSANEARLPAIASWDHMVHVTWMERRNGLWHVYYRGSKNHGRTFSDAIRLSVPSPRSTLITEDGFRLTGEDDQTSITDDGMGNAHAVWSVRRDGDDVVGTVWHAVVSWNDDLPEFTN